MKSILILALHINQSFVLTLNLILYFNQLCQLYHNIFMSILSQANNLEPPGQSQSDNEDAKLLKQNIKESPTQQFIRQRKMAQECCDLGRKYIGQSDYENAIKELSKAVMTFEYILKHNLNQKELKNEISNMLKYIIIPAYSNLSLCYLKQKKYDMVLTFADQVLKSDSANIKNLYRRGIARKFTKAYDEAIQDFQKVMKLDIQMQSQCKNLILQCKRLKILQTKKQKQIAKNFIQGYSKDKKQPVLIPQEKVSIWQRAKNCIKGLCPKLFFR